MPRRLFLAFLVVAVAFVALAGCGSGPTASVAGKRYLNSDESADSRTLEFKQDGTFVFSIVSTQQTWTQSGTYTVAGDKVTLTYGAGQLQDLEGTSTVLEAEGEELLDPDGTRWSPI